MRGEDPEHAGDARVSSAGAGRPGRRCDTLLEFYAAGRSGGSFETGIQRAVARVLVDPQFLFRFEREPAQRGAGPAFPLSDLELASRLSFFLWSSIPDDELLDWPGAAR